MEAGGAGTLTLSGTNTYSGQTFIDDGTLLINANQSGAAGTVFVSGSGSILGGTGTVGGSVFMFGESTITGATTTAVGTMTLNQNVFLATGEGAGGIYLANLSGATSDLLDISGSLTLGMGSTLSIQGTGNGTTTYILATFASRNGEFEDVFGVPANYILEYNATDIRLVTVPEPATWAGAALALGAIAVSKRRRVHALFARKA